jgi:Domain of unknown function (DUF929)
VAVPADRPTLTRTARFAWGAVAILLIGVVALVVYALTDTPVTVRVVHRSPTPRTVIHSLASVPAEAFDAVGVSAPGTGLVAPTVLAHQPPLTTAGRPVVLFVGAEYCPFCAAERWPLVVALSRFGHFGSLFDMQSSITSVFPNTQTFSFVEPHYSSPYLEFEPVELFSNVPDSHGVYTRIATLTSGQQAVVTRYRTGTGPAGSFPFVDIDNSVVAPAAGYSPAALVKLDQGTIVSDLHTGKTPDAKAILASANYLTAGICSVTGQRPASVCASKGVRTAAEALELS